MSDTLSAAVALRIGLAAHTLPETPPARLMRVLVAALGMPLTEQKLNGISVKNLKTALDGELSEMEVIYLKQAVRFLKGEATLPIVETNDELPVPQPYQDGDLPGSIRVAFASTSGARLDGHFGTCTRFLVYQVSAADARLIDLRPVIEPTGVLKDDLHAYRASLISDCDILYVVSIGGPPAAKVIKAGVHPLKRPQPVEIRELLPEVQQMLATRPPPWLRRRLGLAVAPGMLADADGDGDA
jgi:nitrogen fixation protein NifX